MKIWLGLIAAIFLIAGSSTARADHHEVFIHDIILLDPSACAVELQIDEDNQNAFEGTDRIETNGTLLAEIGDTEAVTINTGGNVNAGDAILFASSGFVAETGLIADVEFGNGSCSSFIPGTEFTFVIDDPAFGGPNAIIDSVILPGGFITNVVAFRDSENDSPQLVSLDSDTIVVANNSGESVQIGIVPNNDSGGCQLAPHSQDHPVMWLIGASLLAATLLRRLRHG